MDKAADKFSELIEIMYRLRRECPWDKKQTAESLRPYILEETFEVLESIDAQSWADLAQELGDLLLQIVFQAAIAEEQRRFTLHDVISHINSKLIERHPHVFANTTVKNDQEVSRNWEQIKVRKEKRDSLLSGVPKEAPALLRAQRLQEKAAHVGFDWQEASQVYQKIREEIQELQSAIKNKDEQNIQEELGDLLFSIVNYSRFIGVNAEDALRNANHKFIQRFQKIESYYEQDYDKMRAATLQELDRVWDRIKKAE
jgi:MazG family protein